jgi:hypothetical protein
MTDIMNLKLKIFLSEINQEYISNLRSKKNCKFANCSKSIEKPSNKKNFSNEQDQK